MKDESLQPWIEPEMEARITAFVLGESSDFEADELRRLFEEKEELRLYYEKILLLHELLRGTRDDDSFEDDEWKLPSEKRESIVAVLGGNGAEEVAVVTKNEKRFDWSRLKGALIASAACVVLGAGFALTFFSLGSSEHRASSSYGRDYAVGDFVEMTKDAAIYPGQSVAAPSENEAIRIRENDKTRDKVVRREMPSSVLSSLDVPNEGFLSEVEESKPLSGEVAVEKLGRGGWTNYSPAIVGRDRDGVVVASESDKLEISWDRNYAAIGHGGMGLTSSPEETKGRSESEMFPTVDDVAVSGNLDAASTEGGSVRIGGSFQGADTGAEPRVAGADYNSAARRDPNALPPVVIHNGAPPKRPMMKGKVAKPTSSDKSRFGLMMGSPEVTPGLHSGSRATPGDEVEGLVFLSDSFDAGGIPGSTSSRNALGDFTYGHKDYRSDVLHGGVSLSVNFGDELALLPINETVASEEPFSTFSLHVSDVSFKLAQDAFANGQWPDPDKVRIEEFVNAFDYNDPYPTQEEKVAARLEQAIHPFLQQRNLLRVSIRTAAAGRGASTPLRLTLLLDNSGSMARADRREIVRRAVSMLASQLQSGDSVTLISFARQPRLLAEGISAEDAATLLESVESLPSEGGTNLEAALTLAYEKAKENLLVGAQNRIVLLTDGAANLGDADPESLTRRIELMRAGGVAFDAAGIGTGGLNDEVLEALTRKGDGRYYLLARPEDADSGFAKQLAGAFRPAAGNVKVQLEFNPERVGSYKLLGFEKHRLATEDFRNDQVDAAELAAEEAGVAVYQFEPKADGRGDVGSVSVRFRDMASGEMVERRWPVLYQPNPPLAEEASESMKVALCAALLGARCRGGALGERIDVSVLSRIINGLPHQWKSRPEINHLREMLQKAHELAPSRPGTDGTRF